jgi:hypothetical protein
MPSNSVVDERAVLPIGLDGELFELGQLERANDRCHRSARSDLERTQAGQCDAALVANTNVAAAQVEIDERRRERVGGDLEGRRREVQDLQWKARDVARRFVAVDVTDRDTVKRGWCRCSDRLVDLV